MIEEWHDGTWNQTFHNIPGNGWIQTVIDNWSLATQGMHTAYFKVYQQAGYNNLQKASGLLYTKSGTVEVQ